MQDQANSFETEPCGRCGGSGRYSYNQMHGDRCYGCGGTGIRLSKRGAAAKAYYHGLITKKLSDIKIGDQILTFIGLSAGRYWQIVTAIEQDELNKGQNRVNVHLKRKGETQVYGMFNDSEVLSVSGKEEQEKARQAAFDYQSTLTKAGKPRKMAA